MNVFEKALRKELEVKAYYEKIAAETRLPAVADIFTLLAADEKKHYDALRTMEGGADPTPVPESVALERARGVLESVVGDTHVAAKLTNVLESYRHALEVEAESVTFYQELIENETDARAKRVLLFILKEEKKHYNIVENLYDFALKPQYFLAWEEFSNLRDL